MAFRLPGPLGIAAESAQRMIFSFLPLALNLRPRLPARATPTRPGPVGVTPPPVPTAAAVQSPPPPTAPPAVEPSAETTVDSRSEKNIATLLPEVRPYARKLVLSAAAQGITIKVTSGLRSYAEQDAIYAKGRTAGGVIVTYARGGQSNHNFGIAFDVSVFNKGNYQPNGAEYSTVGPLGEALGLEWGGRWSKPDRPHYQLRPQWAAKLTEPQMLEELRKRKAENKPVYP